MFDSKNFKNYILPISVLIAVSAFSGKFKNYFKSSEDSDYDTIRKYLLNDSPLYGRNRPKIWIHSQYDVNARNWQSFQSRNTQEINQPYIIECIQSIINHCGNDFNICLIDDESFVKLIPGWSVNMDTLSSHHKAIYRHIGILNLIYHYGGMTLPNSFLCLKNLNSTYGQLAKEKKPFVFENINRTIDITQTKNPPLVVPDLHCIGAVKGDTTIHNLINELENSIKNGHISDEYRFKGQFSTWIMNHADLFTIASSKVVGVMNSDSQIIPLEELLGESYINIHPDAAGILIPRDEILKRSKYQWFSVMPVENICDSNLAIGRYFVLSKINQVSNTLPTIMKI